MFRAPPRRLSGNGFTQPLDAEAFRKRQEADFARYEDGDGEYLIRRRPFHERLQDMSKATADHAYDSDEHAVESEDEQSSSDEDINIQTFDNDSAGEEAWRNKEGERLADFGVDEVADFYDEDDLPLAEIMRRRKADQ